MAIDLLVRCVALSIHFKIVFSGVYSDCNDTLSDCAILCNSNSLCENATFSCFPTTNCDIDCVSTKSCLSARINVADNTFTGDFDLFCDNENACRYGSIYCNTFGDLCSIHCDGSSSCRGTQINTLNMAHDGSYNLTLDCTNQNSCRNSSIYCSYDTGCLLNCDGTSGCRETAINGNTYLDTQSGDMNLNCLKQDSCQDAAIYCLQFGTCDILCDGTASCRYSTIYCPDNQDCNINCYSQNACRDSIIYCPRTSGSCNIDCDGSGACRDIKIHCFDDNYCNVTTCSGSSACADAVFINDSSSSYDNLIVLNEATTTTTTATETTKMTVTMTTTTDSDKTTNEAEIGTSSTTVANTDSPSNNNGGNGSGDDGVVIGKQYVCPLSLHKTIYFVLSFGFRFELFVLFV